MITVLTPGLFTTVQDAGRWGYQAYGMPVAGAMDRFAYRMANILAGNQENAAVLEMTIKGDAFRFEKECLVAVCGADMQGSLSGAQIRNWSSFLVPAGSELAFDYAASGCRTYLAVHGGFNVPEVLGSCSTYTRAAVGGLEGRTLKAGDILKPGGEAQTPVRPQTLPAQFIPQYHSEIILRVLLGPQDDLFEPEGIATLFSGSYVISSEADRMGYRLEGTPVKHKSKPDIVSDALCQGAIQVPGHGMPIVMMADRQTTGGYAKIGTVIGPDLSLLAQAKPGDAVRFVQCTDEEAVGALKEERERYALAAQCLESQPLTAVGQSRIFKLTVNGQLYNVEIQEMV
jgi:biotin-dependent carboxylase-like uncharacterized protein